MSGFRVEGLPGFAVDAKNLQVVLRELKNLEPNLRKELVNEMKAGIKPIADKTAAKIPANPPLSGFSPNRGYSPYIWAKPRMNVQAAPSKSLKGKSTVPIVAIKFNDRRPNAGLSILELAGSRGIGRDKKGMTPAGIAMVRNLNRRYPVQRGLGRFVIPDFKTRQAEAEAVAKRILEKFAAKVGRRMS